ncbi:flagellar biosynthesis protein FlgE [Paenalcaligenes hominis]|uniref:Flagellar hook protein FlgE n=1 Tax=Paenalcaligenes hominis TaxID=643674 RepID=A0A1U9JX87_9BURK|nr:flagellar hook protein FlgE [Paenalcaligenes hominis]AQS50339.1 flagellar biosynthesis protein FlgE [Paenalcaligenes hominis]
MGFGQGLSGLNAASQNLDVIGNNIANSATVGFKASTIAFADVYANSRVGLGVQVANVNQRFTTGNISVSGNQFDMAIDGAKGLFRLVDNNGAVSYSRNGQFSANKNLEIVNAQGQRLTGFTVTEDGMITNQVAPIKVPVGNIAPKSTGAVDLKANFDSRSPVIVGTSEGIVSTGTPAVVKPSFNVAQPENHTHTLPVTVYDSLGNPHQLTQYFVKVAENEGNSEWKVYYQFDGKFLSSPTGTVAGKSGKPGEPGMPSSGTGVASGDYVAGETMLVHNLSFDSAGRLIGPYANVDEDGKASVLPFELSITGIGEDGSPAAPLNVTLSYNGSTQFGGEFSPSFTQNGYATGEYSSMSIATDGTIVANYTNGESKIMGALALADFNNMNGLQAIGGNAWVETGASGQPVLGQPGTNGFATVKGQAVEESNVDMSQELVNMIIAQRTYQANAQTIKTQDQILQTLITLR